MTRPSASDLGRRLRRRVLRAAVSADSPLHRSVVRAGWRDPVRLRDLVRMAAVEELNRLLAAAPGHQSQGPEARLIAGLHTALLGATPDRHELTRAAEETTDRELRRLVANRLADGGSVEAAWTVLEAGPRIELAATRMVELVRELRDPAALERLIEHTSDRIRAGAARRRAVRVHREALISRGRVDYRAWEPGKALAWFDRAHEETGPMVRTWTWRAKALRRLGRLQESRESGEAALAERPDWVPALVHMGNLYHQMGDRPASVDCWRRVLEQPKVAIDHLQRTWNGLVRARELELAVEAAQRLVAASGGTPEARAREAVGLWELGRKEEAAQILAEPERTADAALIRGQAWFLGRTGRSLEAHEHLQRLPLEQQGPEVAEELFHMLRRDGHLDIAAQVAKKAASAFPDDHDLRKLRDEIDAEVRLFRGVWRAPARKVRRGDAVRGRVLHVVGRSVPYASSGYCVRTDHTVRAQRAIGIDAHVVTQLGFPWEEGRDAPLEEDLNGVPHHRLPIPDDASTPMTLNERFDRHVDALCDLVERLRPAVLHAASDFRNAVIALEVGERFDLPVVYEMRGFWEETWLAKRRDEAINSAMYRWRRERETEAARRAVHVITLASTMRDDLVARGIDAAKISLAPNAVDPTAFPAVSRDEDLARRLCIGPDEVVVGYISSFTGYEGIHVLIDAVARLQAEGRPIRCLLVGDGEVRPELERQARQLGVGDAVIFAGRVPHDQVLAYYGLIDVFVVPRTSARVCRLVSPLKPYEAMAAGRALVLSRTPVLSTIIDEGVTGGMFEPEDPGDLAVRIAELADDRAVREQLGTTARKHVLEHHTWERNAERYLDVYRRLDVAPRATEQPA